jgi:hypothetical protein
MFDPLTKDELATEAEAWRDIVKARVQEMAGIQIAASKEQNSEAEKLLSWSALLERFINKLVKRSILFIDLLIALSSISVNVGAILALIGGGAFIIGFAPQDTLGNFAAGLMLLVYRTSTSIRFPEIPAPKAIEFPPCYAAAHLLAPTTGKVHDTQHASLASHHPRPCLSRARAIVCPGQ